MAEISLKLVGFDSTLKAIDRMGLQVEQKHMKSAGSQGLTVIAREMRRQAPVVGGSSAIKKTIGSVFLKKNVKTGVKEAKVGVAVGKKRAKIKRPDRSGRSGVGISARNVHWFILGAGIGKKGVRKWKSGRSTGSMDPIPDAGFVLRAFNSSKDAAAKKIIDVLWQKAREEFNKK